MYRKAKFSIFVAATAIAILFFANITLATGKLTERSKVFSNGMGSVTVGMTPAEARQASGLKLVSDKFSDSCYYLSAKKQLPGVALMVTDGRVSRVDIFSNKRVTTLKGAKIGDRESRIKALYPGQIKVSQHQYVQKGHYLTFVPRDAVDKNYRLVFETDGKRVTSFRSGKLPEVEYVEGCA